MSVEKIWLSTYPKGVPHEIDAGEDESIGNVFERACEKFERLPAFTCMGSSIGFGELERLSREFGAGLLAMGLAKGDRVALMMPNLLQYPVALFGVLRAGLVVVNVNPLYTPRELEHQLKDSGARVLVIVENFAKTYQEVAGHFPGMKVVTTQVGDLLGFPKSTLVNLVSKHVKKMVPAFDLPGSMKFSSVLVKGSKAPWSPERCSLDEVAFLQYTGGTTGVAKGAMLTHRNIVSNLRQSGVWISASFVEGKEVAVSPLPLYHIFCLTSTLSFMTWGARNVLVPNPRDMKGFVKILASERWTIITGVNTLFNGLVNAPGFKDCDFSSVKVCVGGGAPVQSAVAKAWFEIVGVGITEAYGLTETSPGVSINPLGGAFKGSIGLPLPSTEISIRSEDFKTLEAWDGVSRKENFTGEICVRGPQVMAGYWNMPEETAKAMREGWFQTGDVGHMDAEGFVYLTDRKKDMILVSGFNVYPNEIEDVLSSCPGLLESAAVGVVDEKSGEAVKVFVVRKDPGLTKEQVLAHCKTLLTGYKIPRQVEFRDSLPKSPIGKILRRELRDKK